MVPGLPIALPLADGQAATLESGGAVPTPVIGAAAILINTYGSAADGRLRAAFCRRPRCVAGAARLYGALDNHCVLAALALCLGVLVWPSRAVSERRGWRRGA